MSITSWFYAGLLAAGILLLVCYHRAGRLLRCLFFTAITGVGALGALWLAGRFIALPLTITPLTLFVSGILGIPGVVALLLLALI